METVIELQYVDPSYNGDVVAESDELATALDQYWRDRRARYSGELERGYVFATNSAAQREWEDFSAHGASFLHKYVKAAIPAVSSNLRKIWNGNLGVAREAKNAFEMETETEIWIPFTLQPLRFACLNPNEHGQQTKEIVGSYHPENFTLGKPHLMVRWRETYLFVVLPKDNFVTLSTFTFTHNEVTWNSGEAIPNAFSEALSSFREELITIERKFAPLLASWKAREEIARGEMLLQSTDRAAAAWHQVHLPESQKLEILRRMELFEIGDPAAPYGMLLVGPSGGGKTMIARTIAESSNCDFQKLSLADIKKENLGASGARVREIWDHARNHRPAIIFVDECDAVFGRRGAAETDVIATDIVQAFLPEWDGIEQTSGIMVVGATNRRDILDDAILSRFGWEVEVKLPAASERRQILEQELMANRVEIVLPESVDSLTQGMSGRDIRSLAAATKSLAYPNAATEEHLIEAAHISKNRGGTRISRTESWATLALEASKLERLKLISALLRESERWRAHGVALPKSLLLTGPDSGIKRQIVQAFANESGLSLLAPTLSELKANILGESGNRVKLLFERGRSHAPAIVFLDRLDVVTPNRNLSGSMDPLTNEIIGQLTQEFDRVQNSDSHIYLIGATTKPDQVADEILDCFSERMEIALPDREQRWKLLEQLLSDKKLAFGLKDGVRFLVQLTGGRGFGSREIENLVQIAEQNALMRAVKDGGPERYSIALEDFDATIAL